MNDPRTKGDKCSTEHPSISIQALMPPESAHGTCIDNQMYFKH